MTNIEQIKLLTVMTGEKDQDVLAAYLSLAKDKVRHRAFPFGHADESVLGRYDGVQVEIAAYLLNKRGAEGETSHSENGVARSYEDGDIPPSLLRQIVPFVSLIGGADDAGYEA